MESHELKKMAKDAAILYIVGYLTLIIGIGLILVTIAFVFHIVVTVEYGKNKKNKSVTDNTIWILLIVGFFISIVPVVALFMVANSKYEDIKNKKNVARETTQNNMPAENITKLRKLKELLDLGIITQEEFEKKKMELLALNSNFGLAHIKKSPSEDFDLDQEVEIKMTDAEIKKLFEIVRVPNGLVITKYKGEATDVRIPSIYKGYKIIEIIEGAFSDFLKKVAFLKKLTKPLTCKKTRAKIFFDSNIEKVTMPSTLEKIGGGAFWGCKNLKKVTLNEGLKEIEQVAFAGAGIEEITIPTTVEEIGERAFNFCDKLRSIECKLKKSYVEANKSKFEGLLEQKSKINWLNG